MTWTGKIRRLMHWFRFTPLHPQWFAYKYEDVRYKKSGLHSRGKIIDIGSGRQNIRKYIGSGCEYHSFDYPDIGEARYKTTPEVFGDAQRLPFHDSSFDTVILLEVIEHVLCPKLAIKEAVRVCKPGGVILISSPFLYPIHDSPNDYYRWTYFGLRSVISEQKVIIKNEYMFGSAVESGVLVSNLAIAWSALNAYKAARLPSVLLAMAVIPIFNIYAYICGVFLSGSKKESPFSIGYMFVVEKTTLNHGSQ